jgi:hypothetical protein
LFPRYCRRMPQSEERLTELRDGRPMSRPRKCLPFGGLTDHQHGLAVIRRGSLIVTSHALNGDGSGI